MPERTCIACRHKDRAETFFRVAVDEQEPYLNEDGKVTGRTAYICRREECVAKALAKDRLARAVKKPVSEEARSRLKDHLLCRLR